MKYILYYETNTCLTCRHFGDLGSCLFWIFHEFSEEVDHLEKIKILVRED